MRVGSVTGERRDPLLLFGAPGDKEQIRVSRVPPQNALARVYGSVFTQMSPQRRFLCFFC